VGRDGFRVNQKFQFCCKKLFARANKTIDTQFSLGQRPSIDARFKSIATLVPFPVATTETFTASVLVFWIRDARMLFWA
jgi:hypothetical protein